MHGTGCVDIVACVDELLSVGYRGALSIEHEPYDRDPTDECIRMREQLQTYLSRTRGDDNE
jgi:sugar phosphate isomerase/epimerase